MPKTINFGPYSIKNLKTFRGKAGTGGYTCAVYNEKTKIILASDPDTGGPVHLNYVGGRKDNPEVIAIKDFADKAFPDNVETVECLINAMVDAKLHVDWVKRQCKKNTMFRVKGDKEGSYRTIKHPYCGEVMNHLHQNYGALIELYNGEGKRII